jgi:hypothetical protein
MLMKKLTEAGGEGCWQNMVGGPIDIISNHKIYWRGVALNGKT